ncbi:MAG: Ig-like domain-containing protein [Chitinophagales bacterium]
MKRPIAIKITFPFILLIILISQILVQTGCANIIPPSGGPRDSLPPVLVKASPGDSTKNFKDSKISFSFDEFIDLQNVRENLIVSPTPKNDPSSWVTFKLNTVTVKPKDTLEPNTTYSLNFGNAIRDYNEGNVLKNFTYIFSTGNFIDSLELHGKVVLAEDGKPDSTLIVMLHRSEDDSAVMKERPRYISKLDNRGNFVFRNLPHGTFYLYAMKDEGGVYRYDPRQLFAFADKPVRAEQKNDSIILYAYVENQTPQAPALSGVSIRRPQAGAAEKRLRFQTNLATNKMDLLDDFMMTFELPLRSFDSSKIRFSSDSSFTPVNNYHFEKDSTKKKIKLKYSWKENTLYHLILDKEFAEDTTGKKLLKTDTLSFTTRKKEEYGALSIHFRSFDPSVNPVLFFIQNGEVKRSFPLSSADFSQSLFLPGDYEMGILYDKNKNGKWDSGEFFGKHKQPEIVKPVERRITVKPDYENEFEIAL